MVGPVKCSEAWILELKLEVIASLKTAVVSLKAKRCF